MESNVQPQSLIKYLKTIKVFMEELRMYNLYLCFLSNVNTTRVGTYKVWYKAYESNYIPGTCTDYKCLVTSKFKTIDYYTDECRTVLT